MTPERLDACPHDRWKGVPDVISQAICSRCSWSATDLVAAYRDRVRELEATKNHAYGERNNLVAALSKLFPAGLGRHPESDRGWEDDWRTIVYIDLPTGQASWHIHDSELPLFTHLQPYVGGWDGHSDDEKYRRLAALAPSEQEAGE